MFKLASKSDKGTSALPSTMFYQVCLPQFLRDQKTYCHETSQKHTSWQVSLTSQGLSLTYLTRSVDHSQIYVYPLHLAPFLRD